MENSTKESCRGRNRTCYPEFMRLRCYQYTTLRFGHPGPPGWRWLLPMELYK